MAKCIEKPGAGVRGTELVPIITNSCNIKWINGGNIFFNFLIIGI